MHEYDISLKLLLRGSTAGVLRTLTGVDVLKWLDIEMPAMQNTRVDLLGETATGELIHIELQSTNDSTMPLRMLEYATRVYRIFGRFPRQILLYVGRAPLRMEKELVGSNLSFEHQIADVREFDGERLLESSQTGDNVIAVLARLRDEREGVRRILARIAVLERSEREVAFRQLMTLAGLRSLAGCVEQEASHMPILDDIMDHEVIGRERKRGIEIGRQEGRQEGELKLLCGLIEKRFGPIPASVAETLRAKSAAELEELGLRFLDANSLSDLLQ